MRNFALGFVVGAWAWPIINEVAAKVNARRAAEKEADEPIVRPPAS